MSFNAAGMEQAVLGYAMNAVWQVPMVFAAAWVTARMLRRSGAAAEHRVWVAALLLEATLPMCRLDLGALWAWVLAVLLPATTGGHGGAVRIALGAGIGQGYGGLRVPAQAMAAIALVFAVSVVYCAARLGWGVRRTEAMRRRAARVEFAGEAKETWRRVTANWPGGAGRLPEIFESRGIFGPVTVGWLRPVVLLPAGFLEAVDGDDLEAVLAHELAHVRRWDFLKNALYEAISLAVAWHPMVWLTRARVAESREMVCDAMAADAVAGTERYARSLLRLAATVLNGTAGRLPAPTLHAIGIFDANSFERRVMNLTMKRVELRRMQRVGIAAACALVALATCATAMALRVEVGPGAVAVAPVGGSGASDNPKVGVGELKIVSRVMPVYPPEAKANHDTLDGPVVLAVTIGKDGAVEDIHVVKSLRADYDRSALDSVRTWRWEPYLLNGEPTEVDSTVTVTYSIPHDKDRPQTQATAEMDKVGTADADSSQTTDLMPKLIHQVEAVYPAEARARKDMLNGSVILGLTVNEDGSIEGVHVDKSLRADYDKSALAAVQQYRFEPAIASGQPIAKSIEVEVNFQSY